MVEQQEQPDPDFPTVAFPNPEEPGAMDLAMALADKVGADLVVANDPDADRCAAAVPGPHGWRMLRGDEVGALLASHLLASGKQGTYATSIVSSSLLGQDGREGRAALRRDAHRLQVDRPGRGARVRLRGGPGLLRGPRARAGQGRGLRAAAALRDRGRRQGGGPHPRRPARRHRGRARAARHRPAVGPRHRPGRDRRRHGPAARRPARLAGRARGGRGRRPGRWGRPSCRRPRACATGWPRAGA